MPRPRLEIPSLRHHKGRNLGVVTVRLANGQAKDLYTGEWGTEACRTEYARIITLVTANGGIYPGGSLDLTVNEAMVRYVKYVDQHYRNPDGSPGDHGKKIKYFLKPLKKLFGSTSLQDFGPVELKTIRSALIAEGLVRKQINKAATIIRQFFRWCVEERLCASSVWETLRAVRPLDRGRSGAIEGTSRQPADPAAVEAALPFLSPAIQAVVRLLRLTGARPTEILIARPCDIDRSKTIWAYTPTDHKTSWKGKSRTIYFGPESQAVLVPWLDGCEAEAFIFSPKRSEELRNQQRAKARKTPRYPSHMRRNATKRLANPKRTPQDRYDHCALARAVERACKKAKVPKFHPYQLRHLRAVELREKYGLEYVRAVLGQTFMSMSDHYSKAADSALAGRAAAEMG